MTKSSAITPRPKNGSLGPWLAGAALAALLLGACAPSSEPSGDVAAGAGGEHAIEIVADEKTFKPNTLRLIQGEKVTVEVANEDDVPHDFAIEEFDLNTDTIEPGGVATATFTTPGRRIDFVCTLHPEMTGRIESL